MAEQSKIRVTSSPHFFDGNSTKRIMLCVIIALIPECVAGVIFFGIPALITILVSVISCICFEAIFQKATNQPVTVGKDLSAIVTGILLALVCPPTIPFWQILLGAAFAVVVAKGFFGGLGCNVWNPALTGRAFMLVSFGVPMGARWLEPYSDVVSSATILSTMKEGVFMADSSDYLQYFLGNHAGCIGETSILLILISCVFLLVTGIIDWRAPLAMVGTVVVLTLLSGGDVLMQLLSGGLMFGAVFMATDYATTPVTGKGRLIFGVGCGLMTFLIRKFGGYPEGVMFSILMLNSIAPFLNKLTTKKYGFVKPVKKEAAK